MKKSLIFITALFTFLTQNVLANTTLVEKPAENSEIKKSEVMVGFYGRPYTPSLGILGESPIDNVVVKLREKGSYYTKELGENFDIQLAFHLIYGLATKDPGKK